MHMLFQNEDAQDYVKVMLEKALAV
jgi:hypothetical protein